MWSPPDLAPRDQRLGTLVDLAHRERPHPAAQLGCRRTRRVRMRGAGRACGNRSGFCSMRIAPNTERSIRRAAGGIGCVRGAGRTWVRRGEETAVALVGADRVALHVCTVPGLYQTRYPLSAAEEYNLMGEVTEVTSEVRGDRFGVRGKTKCGDSGRELRSAPNDAYKEWAFAPHGNAGG